MLFLVIEGNFYYNENSVLVFLILIIFSYRSSSCTSHQTNWRKPELPEQSGTRVVMLTALYISLIIEEEDSLWAEPGYINIVQMIQSCYTCLHFLRTDFSEHETMLVKDISFPR